MTLQSLEQLGLVAVARGRGEGDRLELGHGSGVEPVVRGRGGGCLGGHRSDGALLLLALGYVLQVRYFYVRLSSARM